MPMRISGYEFEGPFPVDDDFNRVAAVYVVSDQRNAPIDVGRTTDLRDRIAHHERKNCWLRNSSGSPLIYARVERLEATRTRIEQAIRDAHSFSCGVV